MTRPSHRAPRIGPFTHIHREPGAWSVQVMRRGHVFSGHFADAVWGGRKRALLAARHFRDRSLLRIGPDTRVRSRIPRRRRSMTGEVGVSYERHVVGGRVYGRFVACWQDPERGLKRRRFLVERYGWKQARALAMELHARLGHVAELEALFGEIKGRELSGPPSSKVEGARQALAILKSQPEYAYRCGPLAVSKLVSLEGMTPERRNKIDAAVSTLNGTTLTSNERLARGLGLKVRMAKRERPETPILVPAVVHWKAGHFAALVRQEGGRYLAQDPTFGDEIWVSRKALEDEASGYFLVKEGDWPAGWRRVEAREGDSVWGKGFPVNSHPGDQGPDDHQACGPCGGSGMATFSFHSMLASLRITDTPVGYTPPRGPAVHFNATYLQREQFLPTIPYFSHLGPKWTFEWLSFIEDAPDNPIQTLSLFVRGGGQESYGYASTQGQVFTFGPYFKNAAVVKRVSTNPIRYEKHLPDGSVEVYAQPDSTFSVTRRVLLTESTDPQGNTIRFVYDETLRLVAVSDAIGQVTTVWYELPSDPLKITRVTDPFGRSAKIDYDPSGRLIRITDVIDLASEFRYGDSYSNFDFIRAMTTPYGTTTFTADEHVQEISFPGEETPLLNYNRFIEATDPLGGKERLEFWNATPPEYGLPEVDPTTPYGFFDAHLYSGVSLYWSKLAMAQGAGDESKATVTNWVWDMHKGPNRSVPMATKRPFESRVWHKYPGQPDGIRDRPTLAKPTGTARILEGGATQLVENEYNQSGKVCKTADPSGRETKYTYGTNNVPDAACTTGSGLHLLKIEQKNGGSYDTLAAYTYNSKHQPLTVTDAAGQMTTYTYNPAGQVLTVTTPQRAGITENRTTTYAYDNDGYLQSVTGPSPGAVTAYTYDGYGRVKTVTDSESYTVTTQYDAMDRPVKVTYPDGTTEETVYNRLDAERHKDRLGRWTQTLHDPMRRVTSIRDPLGRTTQQDWCSCGSLEKIIDANGNETRWERDVQGRVTKEIRADGTSTSFEYDATSRPPRVRSRTTPTTATTT